MDNFAYNPKLTNEASGRIVISQSVSSFDLSPTNVFKATPESTTVLRPPKLADGCFHVFLDVGANIGVHGRFLMQPELYPKAHKAREIFGHQFGPTAQERDNRDICVFAFEPNPAHHDRITRTSQAYAAMGWRYTLIPKGVSDETSTLKFYHRGDENKEEWGFNAVTSRVGGQDATAVDIPVVRLADWIREHVQDRLLPDTEYDLRKLSGNSRSGDTSRRHEGGYRKHGISCLARLTV